MALSLRTGIPYQDLIELDGDVLSTYLALIAEQDERKGGD